MKIIILGIRPAALSPHYHDGYYVSFITTVIIWQDNELVNNVIPFAGGVRVASGAPSGDNSDVVVGGQLSAGCNLFSESQVPTIGRQQVSRRSAATNTLSGRILPRAGKFRKVVSGTLSTCT